jgi:type III secretion protein Q
VLSAILGAEVSVRVRSVTANIAPSGLPHGAAVLLARPDEPRPGSGWLLQAEGALVATVLRRIAHRTAPFAFAPPDPVPPAAVGAFAAVVAAAMRRAQAGTSLRVLGIGPAAEMEADLARGGEALTSVTLTVLVDQDAFEARVVLIQSALATAPTPPWGEDSLAKLGPTPLGLPVVAATFRTTVAELASLSLGDVVVPAEWPLVKTGEGSALVGPVWLAAPFAEVGVRGQLVETGDVVLAGVLEPLAGAEANMGEGVDKQELIDAIGEVPVVVRVEIGEARMSAREWAAVGKGDVVTLGRRLGEPVLLRVGGVPVARGDLVALDGEVGVRIVARLTEPGTST